MKLEPQPSERCLQIKQAMQTHVQNRLQQALQKLERKKEDSDTRKKKQQARDKYQLNVILENGHKVAPHMAIASHISKAIHPDLNAKHVSNLAVNFKFLPQLDELGSHVLSTVAGSLWDATNDGSKITAAYELYLLLDSHFEDLPIYQLLEKKDPDAIEAFDFGRTEGFAMQCLSLLENKCPKPATHTLSKQIYWLTRGNDACADDSFDILLPLYPASLVHQAYLQIQERFSDTNQEASNAKKNRLASDSVFHDYPVLASVKLGGDHPKNVSFLNQNRQGANYKLSSLPPAWTPSSVHLPVHAASVFDHLFIARHEVRSTLHDLRKFLASKTKANKATRDYRKALTGILRAELVSMAGEIQQLPPGWSKDQQRFQKLSLDEQLWLDPLRAELPDEAEFAQRWLQMDWPVAISKRYAQWLNHQLKDQLPVGDREAHIWAKELLTDYNGFKQQLRELRNKLDVSQNIGNRHAEKAQEVQA